MGILFLWLFQSKNSYFRFPIMFDVWKKRFTYSSLCTVVIWSQWCNILNETKTQCIATLYAYSIHQLLPRSWVSRATFSEVPRTGRHTPAVLVSQSTASTQAIGMHWRDWRIPHLLPFFSHLFSRCSALTELKHHHNHNWLQVSIPLCQIRVFRYSHTHTQTPSCNVDKGF